MTSSCGSLFTSSPGKMGSPLAMPSLGPRIEPGAGLTTSEGPEGPQSHGWPVEGHSYSQHKQGKLSSASDRARKPELCGLAAGSEPSRRNPEGVKKEGGADPDALSRHGVSIGSCAGATSTPVSAVAVGAAIGLTAVIGGREAVSIGLLARGDGVLRVGSLIRLGKHAESVQDRAVPGAPAAQWRWQGEERNGVSPETSEGRCNGQAINGWRIREKGREWKGTRGCRPARSLCPPQ